MVPRLERIWRRRIQFLYALVVLLAPAGAASMEVYGPAIVIDGDTLWVGGQEIYHAPWSKHYAKTRIDTSKGERWFCSEAEAIAAGKSAQLTE